VSQMGPTATNDRGGDGAYRCGPPTNAPTCWLDYSTALLESVAGRPSAGCKTSPISLGSATPVALSCSGPWAPIMLQARARMTRVNVVAAAPHLEPLRQAVLGVQGPRWALPDAMPIRICWAVDARGGTAIRFSFFWGGALQKPPKLPGRPPVATVMSKPRLRAGLAGPCGLHRSHRRRRPAMSRRHGGQRCGPGR